MFEEYLHEGVEMQDRKDGKQGFAEKQ